MKVSKVLLSGLFTLILIFIIGAAVLLVFPACDLKAFGSFPSGCPSSDVNKNSPSQKNQKDLAGLLKRIGDLEVQLAMKSCGYAEYQKNDIVDLNPLRILQETDLDAWERKDLGVLAGCWTLTGSEQEFLPVSCRGEAGPNCPVTPSSNAVYCFNSNGVGNVKTEINGNFCEAQLKSEFNQASQLLFRELSNQICPIGTKRSDGTRFPSIVSRHYTCKITVKNQAECEVTNGSGYSTRKIILVRTINDQ